MTPIDKAIVAFFVPIIFVGLSHFGILPQMTVETAVTMMVSGAVGFVGVYFAKNKV